MTEPRTVAELVKAAKRQRQEAMASGRDLAAESFEVTYYERRMLTDTPLTSEHQAALDKTRDHIFGMPIVVRGGSAGPHRRNKPRMG